MTILSSVLSSNLWKSESVNENPTEAMCLFYVFFTINGTEYVVRYLLDAIGTWKNAKSSLFLSQQHVTDLCIYLRNCIVFVWFIAPNRYLLL